MVQRSYRVKWGNVVILIINVCKKKILYSGILVVLLAVSVVSFLKWQDTKTELQTLTLLNTKLEEQNKKLLKANENADKKLDELTKNYDALNEKIEAFKAESNITE